MGKKVKIRTNHILGFARSLNEQAPNMPKGLGDCFTYGQCNGCDFCCPEFQKGKCTTEDAYNQIMIENREELTDDKYNYFLELYKDKKFSEEFNAFK